MKQSTDNGVDFELELLTKASTINEINISLIENLQIQIEHYKEMVKIQDAQIKLLRK